MTKYFGVGEGGHDGGFAGRFRGVEAETAHVTTVQRMHSDELLNGGFRQVALGVIDTVVLDHQEDGAKFLRRSEESGITSVTVHQGGGLVVYVAVYQLLTEQVVLFRRGNLIQREPVRQRTEGGMRKTHRLVEILGQELIHGLHRNGLHHILQQEKVQVTIFVLFLFQLAMGNLIADSIGIVFPQIKVVRHLNIEMLGFISP